MRKSTSLLPGSSSALRMLLGVLFCFTFPRSHAVELTGRDYAVELTANIASDPPEITLVWPGDQYARGYMVRRKAPAENAWHDLTSLDGPSTRFVDRDVQTGIAYEYQVIKDSSFGIQGYGYITAGIQLPLIEDRGTVILLTEAALAASLAPELLRLQFDLVADGWTVERADVSSTNSPSAVKKIIQDLSSKDPARTRALFLFGHIPVAYSGNIMPDGHTNHLGAWPADVFYADLDGQWTDTVVDSTSGEQARQWNVPGDGKWDQDSPPTAVELQTGRVDLSRLTCFQNKTPSRSELDLARQYLDKNHRFRTGQFPVQQRAIIFDRIESKTAEPVAAMAWRNFAPLVGSEVSRIGDFEYFSRVSSGTYLWASVCAGGSYIASDSVGTSDAFALNDVNVVFTTFLGSYYGDWDVESDFLRAALGSRGTLLCTAYSGQPQWLFHPMGLGQTIGYCAKLTQENGPNGLYPPHNNGAGQVHIALLGDPTLHAYPIPGALFLRGQAGPDGLTISWNTPPIDGLIGFLVYKASGPQGPFQRLTPNPVSQPPMTIPGFQGTDTIMVKALALTRTPSGSFYNTSVGAFYPDPTASTAAQPPSPPVNLAISKVTQSSIAITWLGSSAQTLGFRIERRDPAGLDFREIASVSEDTVLFTDSSLVGPGTYSYRVRAFNRSGNSPYSNEATTTTLPATAEFVNLDLLTQGNWIGAYGNDGFIVPGWREELPPNFTLITSNVVLYQTGPNTDERGPQLPGSNSRSANCWVDGTPMGFALNFSDDLIHQVAFYTAAWGRRNPLFDIEMLDGISGASLDHRTFQDIDEGAYAIYNIRRQVFVRITPPSIWTNSEIYGVFFDPAQVAPIQIQPPGGSFAGKVQVTLQTPTPSAPICYTTDGSDPTAASPRYSGPFWLSTNTRLKARAFRDGFAASTITQADFQNSVANLAGLISWDSNTGGDWPGKYGSEGRLLPQGESALPAFCELSVDGVQTWVWADSTEDPRAPRLSSGASRQAHAWYADDSLTVNLGVFDTRMHALSFYFVDYDRAGRVQDVDLLDAEGELKDHYTLRDFENGRYLTLAVQGQCQLKVRRVAGPNAVLSGFFVDPAPPPLSVVQPAPLTSITASEGRIDFSIAAFPGLHLCLDRTTNFFQWDCIRTNLVNGATARVAVPIDPFEPKQFFRVRFVP